MGSDEDMIPNSMRGNEISLYHFENFGHKYIERVQREERCNITNYNIKNITYPGKRQEEHQIHQIHQRIRMKAKKCFQI